MSLRHYFDIRTVRQDTGAVVASVPVSFATTAGVPVAAFDAQLPGGTSLGSTVNSDANGRIRVWLNPGIYRISANVLGVPVTIFENYQAITAGLANPSAVSVFTNGQVMIGRETVFEDYKFGVNGRSRLWDDAQFNGGSGITNDSAAAKIYTNEQGAVVRATTSGAISSQLNFLTTAGSVAGAIDVGTNGGGLMIFKSAAYSTFLATLGVNSFTAAGNQIGVNNINNASAPEIRMQQSGVQRGRIIWPDATSCQFLDGANTVKISYTSSAVTLHNNTTVLGNVTATGQFNGSGAGLVNVPNSALNVISSTTDRTAGKIVDNRGWMGLGGLAVSTALDTVDSSRIAISDGTSSDPIWANTAMVGLCANRGVGGGWMLGASPSGSTGNNAAEFYGRRTSSTASDWGPTVRFWHSGNQINIGTTAASARTAIEAHRSNPTAITDWDNVSATSSESAKIAVAAANRPAGLLDAFYVLNQVEYGAGIGTLIDAGSGRLHTYRREAAAWSFINSYAPLNLTSSFTAMQQFASIGVGTSSMGSDLFRVNGTSQLFGALTVNAAINATGLVESTGNLRGNTVQSRNGFNGVSSANADWGNLIWTAASTWEFRAVGGSRQFGFDGTNITTGIPILSTAPITTSAPITATGAGFFYGANAVLGSRKTGWGAPTGTATRTTFATGSVTTAQLAERVKALIDDLTSHGLIGA